MRKLLVTALFALAAAFGSAQTKIRLFERVTPNPGGVNGDVYYTCNSGADICRLPVSTNGFVLTLTAGLPVWAAGGGGSSPLTTKGDVFGFSSVNARIPIGTNGQAFIADSAQTLGLKWGTLGFAGGGTGSTSFTAGSVPFSNGTVLTQDNLHLFFDSLNIYLGLGAAMAGNPASPLHVKDNYSGFSPIPTGLFENTVGDAEVRVKAVSTQNAEFTMDNGTGRWAVFNGASSALVPQGYSICDEIAQSTCATTGVRFAIDTSANIFTQVGSMNLGIQPGTSTVTSAGKLGVGHVATAAGYLAVKDSACLYGSTSGNICLGLAATGGDATRYNLPVTAPAGSLTLLNCGVPSAGTSTCTFVADANSGGTVTSISTTAPITGCSSPCTTTATIGVSDFVAAGGSHANGTVPDPGVTVHTPPYLLGEDAQFHNPATAGGGNFINSTAAGSEPGSPAVGDVNLPTNGWALERFASSTWANTYGPVYPFTYPPLIASGVSTTINHGGGYTSGATSLVVASGSVFPAVPFLISIGSEDLKVTANSSNTLTVTRGYNSTSAASMADGATVTLVNWEKVNFGAGTTATQTTNQGIYFDLGTDSASNNLRIYKRLIVNTTSGDLQVAFSPLIPYIVGSNVGIILRESATGKVTTFICYIGTGIGTPQIFVQRWSSPTAFTATDLNGVYFWSPLVVFFRFTISGANILWRTSFDGQHWTQLLTQAKTTAFTTGPDEWGLVGNGLSTATTTGLTLYSFKEN